MSWPQHKSIQIYSERGVTGSCSLINISLKFRNWSSRIFLLHFFACRSHYVFYRVKDVTWRTYIGTHYSVAFTCLPLCKMHKVGICNIIKIWSAANRGMRPACLVHHPFIFASSRTVDMHSVLYLLIWLMNAFVYMENSAFSTMKNKSVRTIFVYDSKRNTHP